MNSSTLIALAVTVAADALCGGAAPNEIVCLCVCCLEDQDPGWTWATRRAPESAECACCAQVKRWREGLCYVVRPRAANA